MFKQNNMPLGTCIAFIILSVVSIFLDFSSQILTTISLCSLIFTISQTIQNFLSLKEKEAESKIDAFKQIENLDESFVFILKNNIEGFFSDKNDKRLKKIGEILEISSFVVLVCGFTIPIGLFENEKISGFCTLLSFGFLFFSIWLMDINTKKIKEWNKLKLFSMILNQNNSKN